MPCQPIKMPDGSILLVNVRPGFVLTEEEKESLIEYQTSVRKRSKSERPERYCPEPNCYWAKRNGPCPKHGPAETVSLKDGDLGPGDRGMNTAVKHEQ